MAGDSGDLHQNTSLCSKKSTIFIFMTSYEYLDLPSASSRAFDIVSGIKRSRGENLLVSSCLHDLRLGKLKPLQKKKIFTCKIVKFDESLM